MSIHQISPIATVIIYTPGEFIKEVFENRITKGDILEVVISPIMSLSKTNPIDITTQKKTVLIKVHYLGVLQWNTKDWEANRLMCNFISQERIKEIAYHSNVSDLDFYSIKLHSFQLNEDCGFLPKNLINLVNEYLLPSTGKLSFGCSFESIENLKKLEPCYKYKWAMLQNAPTWITLKKGENSKDKYTLSNMIIAEEIK
jgi:hypothetical protein